MTTPAEKRPVQWSLRTILVAVTLLAAWFAWWRVDDWAFLVLVAGTPVGTIFFSRRFLQLEPFGSALLAILTSTAINGILGFFISLPTGLSPPTSVVDWLGGGWPIVFVVTVVFSMAGGVIGLSAGTIYGIALWLRNRVL